MKFLQHNGRYGNFKTAKFRSFDKVEVITLFTAIIIYGELFEVIRKKFRPVFIRRSADSLYRFWRCALLEPSKIFKKFGRFMKPEVQEFFIEHAKYHIKEDLTVIRKQLDENRQTLTQKDIDNFVRKGRTQKNYYNRRLWQLYGRKMPKFQYKDKEVPWEELPQKYKEKYYEKKTQQRKTQKKTISIFQNRKQLLLEPTVTPKMASEVENSVNKIKKNTDSLLKEHQTELEQRLEDFEQKIKKYDQQKKWSKNPKKPDYSLDFMIPEIPPIPQEAGYTYENYTEPQLLAKLQWQLQWANYQSTSNGAEIYSHHFQVEAEQLAIIKSKVDNRGTSKIIITSEIRSKQKNIAKEKTKQKIVNGQIPNPNLAKGYDIVRYKGEKYYLQVIVSFESFYQFYKHKRWVGFIDYTSYHTTRVEFDQFEILENVPPEFDYISDDEEENHDEEENLNVEEMSDND